MSDHRKQFYEACHREPIVAALLRQFPWTHNLIVFSQSKRAGDLNTAIKGLLREIELLREYRTRLVADVVTSKLDARLANGRLLAESIEPVAALDAEELSEAEREEAARFDAD